MIWHLELSLGKVCLRLAGRGSSLLEHLLAIFDCESAAFLVTLISSLRLDSFNESLYSVRLQQVKLSLLKGKT